jgi:hypothetical protein
MPEGRLRPRELAPIDEFRFERITGRPARFRIGNGSVCGQQTVGRQHLSDRMS